MCKMKFNIEDSKTGQIKKTAWSNSMNVLTLTAALGIRSPINYSSGDSYYHLEPKSLKEFLVKFFCNWQLYLTLHNTLNSEKYHKGVTIDLYMMFIISKLKLKGEKMDPTFLNRCFN